MHFLTIIQAMVVDSASQVDYWVHDLDPFIIRFPESWRLGGLRWYGLSYVAGFAVAYWLLSAFYKMKRSAINPEQQSTFMTVIIIGALVGGRFGYKLFYDFGTLIQDPLSLFRVWEGGMASHGGFIGVLLALLWFAKNERMNFWTVGDIAVVLAPPGIFFGRIANFINGELWGKVTDVSWAVIFPLSSPHLPVHMVAPRHPSQLYAAFLEGLVLFAYTQIRFWRSHRGGTSLPCGQLGGEFLLLYAVVRILGEQFREPDASLILGMSRGAFYSIFMIVAGIALIVRAKRQCLQS